MKNLFSFVLVTGLLSSSTVLMAQEYDDLYFTKKDRKKTKETYDVPVSPEVASSSSGTSFLGRQIQEYSNPTYSVPSVPDDAATSTNEVSEEAINKYKRANIDQGQEEEVVENPNYSVPNQTYRADQEYWEDDRNVTINNYYADSRFGRPRSQWGFNSFWGPWGNGFGVSYGWNSFGNPWFDPFYNNFWYDPWLGWGAASNPWRWNGFYDPFWCPPFGGGFVGSPFYGGFYRGPVVVYNGENRGRVVQRGTRTTRGGSVSSSGRDRQVNNSAVTSVNETRDFNAKQAEYLRRSQSKRISNSNSNVSTTNTRRSSGSSTRSRSSRSTYRNSNTQRNYSTPSNRSYTPTNRSRSNSSGSFRSRTSSPSRNNSYNSSGSSRSRSSGSSRSSGGSGSGRSRRGN